MVWYSHLSKNFPQFVVVCLLLIPYLSVYLMVNQIVGHHLAGRVFPGKEPICQMQETRDVGSVLASGRCPGGGHGKPLQYSCLENPMDRGAWGATALGAAEHGHDRATEHTCTPGRHHGSLWFSLEEMLNKPCMGGWMDGQMNVDRRPACLSAREQLLLCFNKISCLYEHSWGRKQQPTPVLLSEESHGQRNLVDYSPWDHKESDMTDAT